MKHANGSVPGRSLEVGASGLLKALAYLFLAIICFDMMAVTVRLLLPVYSAQELSAYRNVLGILPSLVLLVYTGELRFHGSNLKINQWQLALLRGVVVAAAQYLFYFSLGHLELATISALMQTNSFFVVLLSIMLLGERVGPARWAAMLIGFTGALLILNPGGDVFSPYAVMPVAAAACYAYAVVTLRKFGPEISNALLYLYSALAAGLASIVYAAFTTSFTAIASLADGMMILGMGLLGGTGVLLMMLAYRAAQPSLLAPFQYFSLLTAFAFGWFVFGEAPVDTLFPGVLLILGAGLFIIWRERKTRGR